MRCTGFAPLIDSLLDPDLDADRTQSGALRAHLLWCSDCRDRFEAARTLFALLDALPRESAPAGFAAGVLARVQALGARRHRRRRARLVAAATTGAASILLIVVGTVWQGAVTDWLLVVLGRMATWWYSWLREVAGTMRHPVPVDVPLAIAAVLRAGWLVLVAGIAPVLGGWFVTTVAGVAVHTWTRPPRHEPSWRMQ